MDGRTKKHPEKPDRLAGMSLKKPFKLKRSRTNHKIKSKLLWKSLNVIVLHCWYPTISILYGMIFD